MNTAMKTTTRNQRITRGAAAIIAAVTIGTGLMPAGNSQASMTGGAEVVCSASQNRIEVTPRVVADTAGDQYTATRIWLARYDGAKWNWTPGNWNVELAGGNQNPMGAPIDRLATQTFNGSDGYYYVYVQSYMWNGQSWYGGTGAYTTSYTQFTPSVTHEPDHRATEAYCRL